MNGPNCNYSISCLKNIASTRYCLPVYKIADDIQIYIYIYSKVDVVYFVLAVVKKHKAYSRMRKRSGAVEVAGLFELI